MIKPSCISEQDPIKVQNQLKCLIREILLSICSLSTMHFRILLPSCHPVEQSPVTLAFQCRNYQLFWVLTTHLRPTIAYNWQWNPAFYVIASPLYVISELIVRDGESYVVAVLFWFVVCWQTDVVDALRLLVPEEVVQLDVTPVPGINGERTNSYLSLG